MRKGIIIAFGELFLKSEGVRAIFKKRLLKNISSALEREKVSFKLRSSRERLFLEADKMKIAKKVLKNTFGISWFSESFYFPESRFEEIHSFVSSNYSNWIKEEETFSIRPKIEKGVIKEGRDEVIEKIAKIIKRKVNLKKPKREINIEIRRSGSFVYFKKEKGAGGLPVGSEGRVLSLVSGGIDSPPASYLMAKRGAENVWVHFHSFPLTSNKSIEKTKELALRFLKHQPGIRVYFVPFQDIQLEIKSKTEPGLRVLLYRRKMIEIACRIAEKEECKALITGESLGQVSSQTLFNISLTSEASSLPILRPVIGMDKEEIISLAKKIGSYNISIIPQEDCCTLFVPKKSSGKGDVKRIKEIEKSISSKIVKKAEKEAFFIDIS